MTDIKEVQSTFSVGGVRLRVRYGGMNDLFEGERRGYLGKEFGVELQGVFVHLEYSEGRVCHPGCQFTDLPG